MSLRRGHRARWLAAAFLILLVLVPLAEAHIQGARPILQRSQRQRFVTLDSEGQGLGIKADLAITTDPLIDTISHVMDPSRGRYDVEYRRDGSVQSARFWRDLQFDRVIEFRDANVNGIYEPNVDLVVRSWQFQHYQWSRPIAREAMVADVTAKDVLWTANLTGAPKVRVEIAIAGRDFSDEGAIVRPQDIIIYMDITEMPPRNLGSLYALQGVVKVDAGTFLSMHRAENTSTTLLADAPQRRALFVWGGEALIDGAEQRIDATLGDAIVGDDGNKTAPFILHMPTVDKSMRFVFVSGIEYASPNLRAPDVGPTVLAVAIGLLAFALRRRAR